jgi:hypothetical protein
VSDPALIKRKLLAENRVTVAEEEVTALTELAKNTRDPAIEEKRLAAIDELEAAYQDAAQYSDIKIDGPL